MTGAAWLPLATLSTSLLAGLAIALLREEHHRARTAINLAAALLKLLFVGVMLSGVTEGLTYEARLPFLPGLDLVLRADGLGLFFTTLSAVLWLLTTVYAIGYLEDAPHNRRFFGFFSLCVASTVGNALAGNLLTFFVFYELLTLTTYPLVVHRGTPAALRGGDVYLRYTLAGGAVLLVGVAWMYAIGGPTEFTPGGSVGPLGAENTPELIAIFALLIAGFGVKAALFPVHGWLPVAMVAPAPVSALLHAVAVVKAGAFGIVRVVYELYGVEAAKALGVLRPLAGIAGVTIVYGSARALAQRDIKRRLAFSTVSQVSFIVLGVAVAGEAASIGGLSHLVHQGLMKITLFFCAGMLAETLGIHTIDQLRGAGRRMPVTMFAFTVGALGMIGLPPFAGFVTKWYLGVGALQAGQPWVLAVLGASVALNAAYFLPLLHAAWFQSPAGAWIDRGRHGRLETSALLLAPSLLAALLSLVVGLFASAPFTPVTWAALVVMRELYP